MYTAGVHVPQGGHGVGSGILEAGVVGMALKEMRALDPTWMQSSGLVVAAS